ncbi:hypothetical protein [Halorubrum luteum]
MQTGTNPDRCSGMEQESDGSAPTTGTCRTNGRGRALEGHDRRSDAPTLGVVVA